MREEGKRDGECRHYTTIDQVQPHATHTHTHTHADIHTCTRTQQHHSILSHCLSFVQFGGEQGGSHDVLLGGLLQGEDRAVLDTAGLRACRGEGKRRGRRVGWVEGR